MCVAAIETQTAMAATVPFVYSVENTGADYPDPKMPDAGQLPTESQLPNPFEWSDGSGKITDFCEWSQRRNEIKREIEHYEIGEKPKFDDLTATYSGGTLTVKVTYQNRTLTLTSKLSIPSGSGPHPVVIGMDGNTGSLGSNYFSKCIQVPFTHSQIAGYSSGFGNESKTQNDPFFKLYPGDFSKGDYCAWSWGISRLIDGLEIVKDQINADLKHIAVTGCSYAGKMALYAGAFDERIALTIAQESGGGGINSWRVSEKIGSSVEGISNTNYDWFMPSFKNNFNGKTGKIPYDHHELIAMIAPRAFLAFGNPDYTWLGDESGYVSLQAAQQVWEAMGIPERFGYVIEGGHSHCQASSNQNQAADKFIKRFLYGDESQNTTIRTSTVRADADSWMSKWKGQKLTISDCGGGAEPRNDTIGTESYWMEAEAVEYVKIGSNFSTKSDDKASGGEYVEIAEGMNSTDVASDAAADQLMFHFTATKDTMFYIYGRLNCQSYPNDSYWVRIDDDDFVKCSGMITQGEWQWFELLSKELEAGEHTVTFAYREEGAKLDKLCITSLKSMPLGSGEPANAEPYEWTGVDALSANVPNRLEQNVPNPAAGNSTEIPFSLSKESEVTITVTDIVGTTVAVVAKGRYEAGRHSVTLNTSNLPSGVYIYTLQSPAFTASKKLHVMH